MAKLAYADIIERDQRYRALAELGLRLDLANADERGLCVHMIKAV